MVHPHIRSRKQGVGDWGPGQPFQQLAWTGSVAVSQGVLSRDNGCGSHRSSDTKVNEASGQVGRWGRLNMAMHRAHLGLRWQRALVRQLQIICGVICLLLPLGCSAAHVTGV